jgi:hypothetical protein
MPAPMPEKQFLKMVKGAGCTIEMSGSHGSIYRPDGTFVSGFAVSHKQGGKREVKPAYIKLFWSKL